MKAFDRGSILLVVCTASSLSMAEHIWSTVSPWRVVAVAGVCAALLADHAFPSPIGLSRARPAESCRRRSEVMLFMRHQEEPGLRPTDGVGVLRHRGMGLIMLLPLMIFHQIQLFVCVIVREPNVADGACDISCG